MTFRSLFTMAALAAAMLFATGASSQAAYTLTSTSLAPASSTIGGTTFTLVASGGGVQTGSTPSNFATIDVNVTSSTGLPPVPPDAGMFTVTQTFTLVGTGPTPGNETFTLTGPLVLTSGNSGGVVSTFAGTITNLTGSGFLVSYAGYAPPSPGSPGVTGKISITVIPTAIPEPASMVMLGCGLVGVFGLGLRRMKKA